METIKGDIHLWTSLTDKYNKDMLRILVIFDSTIKKYLNVLSERKIMIEFA